MGELSVDGSPNTFQVLVGNTYTSIITHEMLCKAEIVSFNDISIESITDTGHICMIITGTNPSLTFNVIEYS